MLTKNTLNISFLHSFCQHHGIRFLGLFGSVARGEADETSDIDLFARFFSPKGLLEIVRLERELSEALGYKVDLQTEGSISPHLKDRIFREMEVLYEKTG